jgi:fused-like protein
MKVKEIGKYLLQDLIGEGSFGKVYRGVDRTSNELVALKFIMRKGKNRKELEGLRQEIEILKKLKHENIIQLRDHIETQN